MFSNEINSKQWSNIKQQKSLILGGSKGLGLSISEYLKNTGYFENIRCLSRRSTIESLDFSKPDSLSQIKKHIFDFKPELIFYVAGGGVHGPYFSKPSHSHRWTFEVNFFRPTEIAEHLKNIKYQGTFVYIGSAIAERSHSKTGLSYSESKKLALKTLLSLKESELKVRVFSPPYMDTALLPQKTWPRLEAPHLVLSPDQVAAELLKWLNGNKANDFHNKTLSENSDPRHFDWMQRFKYDLPIGKDI